MVRVQRSAQQPTRTDYTQTGNLFPARLRTTHIEKHQNMTYRRNGKLQACEPCRKGKLRCDHMMPHCGRCVKTRKSDKCVYHPAPLTKLAAKTSRVEEGGTAHQEPSTTGDNFGSAAYVAHLESTGRPNTFQSFSSSVSPTKSPMVSTPTPFLMPSSLHPEKPVTIKPRESSVGQTLLSGLQGFDNGSFISHSAILAENEPKLGLSPPALSASSVSQKFIDSGVAVLMRLKDLSSIQRYIDKWFSFAGGVVVIEPMVKIYLEGIWSTWGKILESAKITDLQSMSAQIWENTSRPLSDLLKRDTTPREFCACVTGAGLRWEVVGIITSVVPLIAQSLKGTPSTSCDKELITDSIIDGDPIFCSHDAAPVDKDALAVSMHDASEMCVKFCDELDILNDLYLWLLYGNSVAYCSLRSRGSKSTAYLA